MNAGSSKFKHENGVRNNVRMKVGSEKCKDKIEVTKIQG